MAQTEREVKPQFTQPWRQVFLMLIALGLTSFVAFLALPQVLKVFQANPYLNGFIVFVFVLGVLACFWQVLMLIGCVRWIDRFAEDPETAGVAPTLLAPLAALLRSRGARMQISATSTRSILDSVATRIDEAREITRYIVNMLIFLGLLGTFYGLATTVPAVVETIRSLTPKEGEGAVEVFNRLMGGLEAQLDGMGVAFASSLLGLAGSLVVGLLELFAGHGQNRFYRELEEWLSSITRLGFATGEDGASDAQVIATVMDNLSEQMETLQQMFAQADANQSALDDKLGRLTDAVTLMAQQEGLSDHADATLTRIANGQERLLDHLQENPLGDGMDAESRMRLRSIDVQMLRILEEISAGRQESVAALRSDLKALKRRLGGDAPAEPKRRFKPGE